MIRQQKIYHLNDKIKLFRLDDNSEHNGKLLVFKSYHQVKGCIVAITVDAGPVEALELRKSNR